MLGLDSATRRAAVGAIDGNRVLAEEAVFAQSSHAASLPPLIEATLARASWTMRDLDIIAVSIGPGSFSGLRVGLSLAKGMAYALGIPLVPVPTLEALARSIDDASGVICPVLDARKGELYAAAFTASATRWQRLLDDTLLTPDALLQVLPTPCTVIGDAVPVYGELLTARLGGAVRLLPFETFAPRGATVARLGMERLRAGNFPALDALEPFYIRPSDAEKKAS